MVERLYKILCNKYVLTVLTLFTLSKTVIAFINGSNFYETLYWGTMVFINLLTVYLVKERER